jgi:protein-tyrosine phosphatase
MKLALASNNGQGRCLVHCAAGVSRSSTITIAFLVRECHFSLREAFDLLRERRPICWPNAGFMRGLIAFEARIHSGRTSLDIAEYETWTNVNSEAVIFAKRVDRDREAAR